MSTTTRLLVLGVVKVFQPVHGYEVRRELITWRAQEWASVQPGSIYNALKTLTRDGFLEIVGTDQVGGRPERTSYQLTLAGDDEFRNLLREQWWNLGQLTDPLMAAISFLGLVSRKEAIAALEHRIAQIHGMARQTAFVIEAHDGSESPYHVREMMRLMNARAVAEIGWAEQFIERLRNGEYATADDPQWQPAALSSPPQGAAKLVPPARKRAPAAGATAEPRKRTAAAAPASRRATARPGAPRAHGRRQR